MSASVNWGGSLEVLAKRLRACPKRLMTFVIDPRMKAEVDNAADLMRTRYTFPSLAGGVKVQRRGPGNYKISNAQPHAHLFELGTVVRHRLDGRTTGRMPATPVLIPEAIAARGRIDAGLRQDVAQLDSSVLLESS